MLTKKSLFLSILFLLSLLLTSCAPQTPLEINNAWARPALAGNNTAAYFVVTNQTNQDDQLLSASSEISEYTQVHLSLMEDGNMVMKEQEFVVIPANSSIEFKPKDYHIMFINLKNDINIGDSFTLTLNFEKTGQVTIDVPVKEQ